MAIHLSKKNCEDFENLNFEDEREFDLWKKENIPDTFSQRQSIRFTQNFVKTVLVCNNIRLNTRRNSQRCLSQTHFKRTFIETCMGKAIIKQHHSGSTEVLLRKCTNIEHHSQYKISDKLKHFICKSLHFGLTTSQARLRVAKKFNLRLPRHTANNLKERLQINMGHKLDQNDHISSINMCKQFRNYNNLKNISRFEQAVIIFKVADFNIDSSESIFVIDSTHNITR